jgi:Transposase DDE domain
MPRPSLRLCVGILAVACPEGLLPEYVVGLSCIGFEKTDGLHGLLHVISLGYWIKKTHIERPWMAKNIILSLVCRLLNIPERLKDVVASYLLVLMLDGPKRTLSLAASVSGSHKSQFSRLLSEHPDLAAVSLKHLAKDAAKLAGLDRGPLVKGTSWTVAILVDATLHPRSSLHVQNSQRFNHGQGFVIGHQWTNIVLFINGQLIPLPPIAFLSRNECKRRKVAYQTEHERLATYLEELQLSQYVGFYRPEEVVVITDSGYDNKKLQRLILEFGWDFIAALKSSRSVQTHHETVTKPKDWRSVSALFKAVKKAAPWKSVRIETDGGKKRRTFRARKLTGRIKGVMADVAIVCSEKTIGKGRRYFACSNTRVTVGAILRAYKLRWAIELFHRAAKSQFGMLDAGLSSFDAMTAHVHWVYCTWLLLHKIKIADDPADRSSLLERQRWLQKLVAQQPMLAEVKRIFEARTQFGGLERQKKLVREILTQGIANPMGERISKTSHG